MKDATRSTIAKALGRETVHPFPARMAPGLALAALAGNGRRLRVLDPMSGSGTVLALARSAGHRAIGVDIDPLAVLIARVWTTPVSHERVTVQAGRVLLAARRTYARLRAKDAYPPGASDETKAFLRYWFDATARRQLEAIAQEIRRVRERKVRDVLWCAFSRMIIAKQAGASRAMDLSHSRPHRVFDRAPALPFDRFAKCILLVLRGVLKKNAPHRGPRSRVFQGDARELPLPHNSVDLVLTSPPYLNAIDYVRCSKFALVWMGFSVESARELRGASVGAERGLAEPEGGDSVERVFARLRIGKRLDGRQKGLIRRYIADMRAVLEEAQRVLVPGGRAVLVVGENTVRGVYVRNATILRVLGEDVGLLFESRSERALPAARRYLPPPGAGSDDAALDTRMRKEVIIAFLKSAA